MSSSLTSSNERKVVKYIHVTGIFKERWSKTQVNIGIHISAFIGILAASYAKYVEYQLDIHRTVALSNLPSVVKATTTRLDPFNKLKLPGNKAPSSYKAMCDFETSYGSGSCSKVFESSVGHILSHWGIVPKNHFLDLSLAVIGMFLYSLLFLYPMLKHKISSAETIFVAICSASILFSMYLLYVLKFELEDFCVVCFTFHSCNFSMFYLAILEYNGTCSEFNKNCKLKAVLATTDADDDGMLNNRKDA